MNISEVIKCDNYNATVVNTNKISSLVGTVTMLAFSPSGLTTTSIPGYLVCDGSWVNIATYQDLYDFLNSNNTNYPQNATQFQLPDLRGVFLRCMPLGTGNDGDGGSSRGANVYQGYAMKRISGRTCAFQNDYEVIRRGDGVFWSDTSWGGTDSDNGRDSVCGANFYVSRQCTTGPECRPNNMAFLACIKY